MPLPLLEYPIVTGNHLVQGFEGSADSEPKIFTTENLISISEMEDLIGAAYRQIFHEQQFLTCNRQAVLETQLKIGQITVKEFIKGLATSDSFRRLNYEANNNYRFAEICVQRILGRRIYGEREKIAWSIVIATKGLNGFIDELLNSEEYVSNFGDNTVPYQRKRKLRHWSQGEVSFEHMARYGAEYRNQLPRVRTTLPYKYNQFEPIDWNKSWPGLVAAGGVFLALIIIWIAAAGLL